jgi:hypothetical protein
VIFKPSHPNSVSQRDIQTLLPILAKFSNLEHLVLDTFTQFRPWCGTSMGDAVSLRNTQHAKVLPAVLQVYVTRLVESSRCTSGRTTFVLGGVGSASSIWAHSATDAHMGVLGSDDTAELGLCRAHSVYTVCQRPDLLKGRSQPLSIILR